MFELSLSPAIAPAVAPVPGATTPGTIGFAQVLANATGDAAALLSPLIAESLPPERQIPAAHPLPVVDGDIPNGDAPLSSDDLATLILVPRPPSDVKVDAAPFMVAEAASDVRTRAVPPDHVAQLPVVATRPPAPIAVAVDRSATVPAGLASSRRANKAAEQPEPIEHADAPEATIQAVALTPVSAADGQLVVSVQAEPAPTPAATASTATAAAPPSVTGPSAIAAVTPATRAQGAIPTPTITIAPAARPVRLPIGAVAIPTSEAAVLLPAEALPRPVSVDVPSTEQPLRGAGAVPPIARELSNPGIAAGSDRTVILPHGVVITVPTNRPSPVPGEIIPIAPVASAAIAARTDTVITATPAPVSPPLIGVPVPALRAFAAAIAATNAPFTPQALDDEAPILSPAVSVQPDATIRQTEVSGRSLPPIDMQREDWTRALIDRIDAVRDVANARDTRIALVPDALGKIEVALRQDGDTLHVAFTADAPATRALLAEAQPRLAELAEARGLKLGDTAVSTRGDQQNDRAASGFGQPADQRRPAPAPQGSASNRSTSTNPAPARADSDNRIA